MKSTGPGADPCGTLLRTAAQAESDSATQTLCFLPIRKCLIQLNNFPEIPYSASLVISHSCGTNMVEVWTSILDNYPQWNYWKQVCFLSNGINLWQTYDNNKNSLELFNYMWYLYSRHKHVIFGYWKTSLPFS